MMLLEWGEKGLTRTLRGRCFLKLPSHGGESLDLGHLFVVAAVSDDWVAADAPAVLTHTDRDRSAANARSPAP